MPDPKKKTNATSVSGIGLGTALKQQNRMTRQKYDAMSTEEKDAYHAQVTAEEEQDAYNRINSIDQIEEEAAFQYELTMDGTGESEYYTVGENVSQDFTDYQIEGEVTYWNHETRLLKIAHTGATDGKYHEWGTDQPIVGADASLTPVSADEGVNEIQRLSQNKVFSDFANDFVDFSESNPFGDLSP